MPVPAAVPIAGLPAPKAMVKVGPPLSCKGPRLICAPVTVAAPVKEPVVIRLLVDNTVGALPTKSPPLRLLAIMVFTRLLMVALFCMPPPDVAELPERVEFVTLRVDEPEKFNIPPPFPKVVLP